MTREEVLELARLVSLVADDLEHRVGYRAAGVVRRAARALVELTGFVPDRRVCARDGCDEVLPDSARADAVFCSTRCRQRTHRATATRRAA